jgi:hypothetical protein
MTEIVLYHFSKRKNSTKRPTGQGTEVPCLLKSATTFQNPTFILQKPMNGMLQFNYVKWADHYYFIDSTTSINAGQTEISCTEDVLATYKNEISNYTCFIERSRNQTTLVNDTMYIPTNDWVLSARNVSHKEKIMTSTYSQQYIIRIVSRTGVASYYINGDQLNNLLDYMYTESNFTDVITDGITKLMFDPFKYIVDLKWIPFVGSAFKNNNNEAIQLGFWDSGVMAKRIDEDTVINFSYSFAFDNPLYAITDFRYYSSSFSNYFIKLPFIGVVALNPYKIDKSVNALYQFDATSGLCNVFLQSKKVVFASYQFQLSVPVQIGYASTNIAQLTTSAVSLVSAGLQGNIAQGISSGIEAGRSITAPEVSMLGTIGNISNILNNQILEFNSYACTSIDPDGASEGYADGNTRKISTCSGYLRCRNASIEISGFTGDQEAVNNYLNSGFYYE